MTFIQNFGFGFLAGVLVMLVLWVIQCFEDEDDSWYWPAIPADDIAAKEANDCPYGGGCDFCPNWKQCHGYADDE